MTPTQRLTDRKREAIVQAAIVEFRANGFDATSVDKVAARAEVSKRTLYNHFPSKDALFLALVSEVGERISVSATLLYSPTQSLREQILRFVAEAHAMISEPETLSLMRAVLAEHIRHPERVEPILHGYWRNEYGFTSWAEAAVADGRLVGTPSKIGHALTSMMRAHIFWPTLLGRLDVRSSAFREDMMDAIEMFLQFYSPKTSTGRSPRGKA